MKKKLFEILSVSKKPGSPSWYFDVFIISLIILNIIAIIVESIEPVSIKYEKLFYYFELISIFIFTIEYILRIWTANLTPEFNKPFTGNLKFALTPLAIIDLLVILPFYLPFIGIDLRFLRVLRILRIFRIFKISRYIKALALINTVVIKKKEELIISLIFTAFMLLITSSIMYYVENPAQPENFSSIPETMWWGIATLTTVGYGDVYPVTPLGKFLGGIIAIIGVGLFVLPAGILASGFSDTIASENKKPNKCPNCGTHIN